MSRESRVVSGIRDILESHGLYVINIFGGATTGLDGNDGHYRKICWYRG